MRYTNTMDFEDLFSNDYILRVIWFIYTCKNEVMYFSTYNYECFESFINALAYLNNQKCINVTLDFKEEEMCADYRESLPSDKIDRLICYQKDIEATFNSSNLNFISINNQPSLSIFKKDIESEFSKIYEFKVQKINLDIFEKTISEIQTFIKKTNHNAEDALDVFKSYIKDFKNRNKITISMAEFETSNYAYPKHPFTVLLKMNHPLYKIIDVDNSFDEITLKRFKSKYTEEWLLSDTKPYTLILATHPSYVVTLTDDISGESRTCKLKRLQYKFLEKLIIQLENNPEGYIHCSKLRKYFIKGRKTPDATYLSNMAKALRYQLKSGLAINTEFCEYTPFVIYSQSSESYSLQKNIRYLINE